MLEQFDCGMICPECQVLRTKRSRHCNLCNRCIDRFDHHCPWVNNCIGRRNFNLFYGFIIAQCLWLLSATLISGYFTYIELSTDSFSEHSLVRRAIGVLLGIFSTFFFFSLSYLCIIQTGNLFVGKTMPERYSSSVYRLKIDSTPIYDDDDYHDRSWNSDMFNKPRLSQISIDDSPHYKKASLCSGVL